MIARLTSLQCGFERTALVGTLLNRSKRSRYTGSDHTLTVQIFDANKRAVAMINTKRKNFHLAPNGMLLRQPGDVGSNRRLAFSDDFKCICRHPNSDPLRLRLTTRFLMRRNWPRRHLAVQHDFNQHPSNRSCRREKGSRSQDNHPPLLWGRLTGRFVRAERCRQARPATIVNAMLPPCVAGSPASLLGRAPRARRPDRPAAPRLGLVESSERRHAGVRDGGHWANARVKKGQEHAKADFEFESAELSETPWNQTRSHLNSAANLARS